MAVLGDLFLGGAEPVSRDAADANDDGRIDISDPTTTLDVLFLGGAPPPEPNVVRALDRTYGALTCDGF